jgi:hypothetical protein
VDKIVFIIYGLYGTRVLPKENLYAALLCMVGNYSVLVPAINSGRPISGSEAGTEKKTHSGSTCSKNPDLDLDPQKSKSNLLAKLSVHISVPDPSHLGTDPKADPDSRIRTFDYWTGFGSIPKSSVTFRMQTKSIFFIFY